MRSPKGRRGCWLGHNQSRHELATVVDLADLDEL
jgi:hypothetical protein